MRYDVIFWLPCPSPRPIGGVRVVYELANRLAAGGARVAVAHATRADRRAGWSERLRGWRDFAARTIGRDGGFRVDAWCEVNGNVSVLGAPFPGGVRARAAWHVATSWETAEWLPRLTRRGDRGAYLVQNDERSFERADALRVETTWRAPVARLVTGAWLAGLLSEHGGEAVVIGQGVDYQKSPHFYRAADPTKRRDSIMMMHHAARWKRSSAGVAAIRAAEAEGGRMAVALFGVGDRPPDLPEHWEYLRNPSQARLAERLGETEIFVGPSATEGFALPPCEAMLAGCACVLTDIGGHRDAGVPDETALMPALGDDEALARAITRLRRDGELRSRLARAGRERVRGFLWDEAAGRFARALGLDQLMGGACR